MYLCVCEYIYWKYLLINFTLFHKEKNLFYLKQFFFSFILLQLCLWQYRGLHFHENADWIFNDEQNFCTWFSPFNIFVFKGRLLLQSIQIHLYKCMNIISRTFVSIFQPKWKRRIRNFFIILCCVYSGKKNR